MLRAICVLVALSVSLIAVPAAAQHAAAELWLAAADTSAVQAEVAPRSGNRGVLRQARLRRALSGPFHPVRAAQFGIEGEARVAYTVNLEGRARDIVILESLGHDFDAELRRVLRQARFYPASDSAGQAVPSRYVTTFVFSLGERR